MRVLLLYPRFPQSFWSMEKALALVNRQALLPPLGLITVSAILPQTWEFKLVDRNVREVTEAEWDWAELVILSAMIVQKADFWHQIQEAHRRGKRVAVGGPYPTALPQEAAATGADYLILDEGEITLPLFVAALEQGVDQGIFRAEGQKPDVTTSPVPRFDLLNLAAYDNMAIQFSRGCPFQCEFCDIIVLYGRKPRTKTPTQLLAELECLYALGWRGTVFLVDDNFIGNKHNVKKLLRQLQPWMQSYQRPFNFHTEASVDLAQDPELLELMVACNFNAVFLGIETPDADSLSLTRKYQNTRSPLVEAVDTITDAGLRVMAGFIIGFDGEQPGAGDRIVAFVEQTAIPTAMFSMLQALPGTALWQRLAQAGRLLPSEGNINQTTLINFIPTRPLEEIADEYIRSFWQLYDPETYLARTYRYFLKLGTPKQRRSRKVTWINLRALLIVCWRQGFRRQTRWQFWSYLARILWHKPQVWDYYLSLCALNEHFMEYRQVVQTQIQQQLSVYEPNSIPIGVLPKKR